MFKAVNSQRRLLFHDTEHDCQVGVFVGSFRMCDELPVSDRNQLAGCRDHLGEYHLPPDGRQRIRERPVQVLQRIDDETKTRDGKLRAEIGDSKRWYQLPGEVEQ